MSSRIIAFVDHEIGFRLLEKMIAIRSTAAFELISVVTTEANGAMWWPGVAELCSRHAIPLHRYREPFNDTLDYFDVDWYFLLSWKHLIPARLIEHPKRGVINLHYSLLPEYRGVYPVNWAIIEGRKSTGVTYHTVTEKIDAGEIIAQCETQIGLQDTARTLQLRLDDVAYDLFDDMLAYALQGTPSRRTLEETRHVTESYKSYDDFIATNELDLNREYTAGELLNLLRGKTFFGDNRNLYVVDPATGNRIYLGIDLKIPEQE